MKNRFRILFILLLAASISSNVQAQKVKNIIFMIGDGMGLAQVSAVMVNGNYAPIAIERAQYVGLTKTYSYNNQVTDSAAAGTALATGVKTANGTIGMTHDNQPLSSILDKAAQKGMATGLVVTCYLPHATPAAFCAHQSQRSGLYEIAAQIVDRTYPVDVLIGGGNKYFTDRHDKRDLLKEFADKGYTVASDMNQVQAFSKGRLAAVLADDHMPSMIEGRSPEYLPTATLKALEILKNDSSKGFFIMIEGSQIDFECHSNNAEGVLAETRDFDNAVKVAMDFADRNPGTLVVVTADHETGGMSLPVGEVKGKADIKFSTSGHSGTLVPVYAYGAGASNFTGVYENTEVPRIMAKLLGIK